MSDPPPPYVPSVFGGPSTHSYPPGGTAPTFPGYQPYSQPYGGDNFYQGPPRPPEAYLNQPSHHGYSGGQSGTAYLWNDPKAHGNTSKQPVFMMDQPHGDFSRGGHGGGGEGMGQSLLAACSATMCCCCLWKMLSQYL